MIAIRIQRARGIQDCETEIERDYYDWGREKGKQSWLDPTWDEATPEQRLRIAQRGYLLYDGCPVPKGNAVTPVEAWVSAGFRSRVVEYDVVRLLAHAEHAPPLLALIP